MDSKSHPVPLPHDRWERYGKLTRITTRTEDRLNLLVLARSLWRIIRGNASQEDYETVYHARLMRERSQLQDQLLDPEQGDEMNEILEFRRQMENTAR